MSSTAPSGIQDVLHGGRLSITSVRAEQVLDSRGWPTISVALTLDDGSVHEAAAPAGASTGAFEAVELRDDAPEYSGRGVLNAVAGVEGAVAATLTATPWDGIRQLDDALRELDGTPNLARLGANAIVAVSMAASRGFAHLAGVPLYVWIAAQTGSDPLMPVPHFNVLNGGAHAANDLDFQEFMIAPVGVGSEQDAVRAGSETYHALQAAVRDQFHTAGLGDEGGFAPPIANPVQALDLLVAAIATAGYTTDQVKVAIDPAANGFYLGDGNYQVDGRRLDRRQLVDYYDGLLGDYPIWSLEDGMAENDFEGWQLLFERVGDRAQVMGDDLFVTDPARIRQGAAEHYANSALIKVNQIGTVSQTFDAIAAARENDMTCMVSHRSGETPDTFIADLVVGTGVGQIKSGAPARGERVAKYNRLMSIERSEPRLRYGLR
ncbi:phosphopyruvate hydratase [Humibacter ginsenosidimutans]|uniref:Enolase n=1 Tax=Humibacter ginsenosidimutans TaxID=2599293 RepID=A0A5B8M3H6_9MICO|nr:phosphopyruvate hydratase [Humibacter ginsenosidimutans]QDZ14335.1 phosphopyruvate hydratase [Humibacter ginsenosidimutans]